MDAPDVIAGVRHTPMHSVARLYGRCTAHGVTYVYHKKSDTLVREDIVKAKKKRK